MSSYLNDLESQDPVNNQSYNCDACMHVRNIYTSLTNYFGKSTTFTSLFIIFPMLFMLILLTYFSYGVQTIYFKGSPYAVEDFNSILSPPLILLTCVTFVNGGASLVALCYGFQNVMGLCSLVYSAIAYWALVNSLIVVCCTYNYLDHHVIGYAFLTTSSVSLLWLFSSAVMNAHRKVMDDA